MMRAAAVFYCISVFYLKGERLSAGRFRDRDVEFHVGPGVGAARVDVAVDAVGTAPEVAARGHVI